MHQTRQAATTKLPIPRKGTTYVARASSHHRDAVPVVVAIRDMLHLATTAKEVRTMLRAGTIKVNGKPASDYRESIRLFNLLEAGKTYRLSLLPTGKFVFEETTAKDGRLCKVVDKRLLKGDVVQLNLHDGSNVLTKDKIATGDSVYLDDKGKVKKHLSLQKGQSVFILSGRHQGKSGKVAEVHDGKLHIHYTGGDVLLQKSHVIAV